MERLIEVFDGSRRRIAVLADVWGCKETRKLNGVGEMEFSLPVSVRAAEIAHRRLVRYAGGELYRVIDTEIADAGGAPTLTCHCEHVSAGLADRVLFGDVERVGYSTAENLAFLLRDVPEWGPGECEFDFHYDYAWTSENILAALFSLATPFVDYYRFEFDTGDYPWRVHLRRIDMDARAGFVILAGKNQISYRKTRTTDVMMTRLFLLGYGEGVNQLDVRKINGGHAYIEDAQAIADFGLIERVYTDRSITDAQRLLEAGQALLREGTRPRDEYDFSVTDLRGLTGQDLDGAEPGEVALCKSDNYRTYITEIQRDWDSPGSTRIKLASSPEDLVETLADLADKQRIEATYAQGSTQIWGGPLIGEADDGHPFEYPLWIPKGLTIMNYVQVKIKLDRFRATAKSARAGGGSASTTSSGGGSTSSASGGGTYTSSAGGAQTVTEDQRVSTTILSVGAPLDSADGTQMLYVNEGGGGYTEAGVGPGAHTHLMAKHRHYFRHYHTGAATITIPAIVINIPSHRHSITASDHTHTISAHTHSVTIPEHTHDIVYGIYTNSVSPQSATVTVGNGQSFSMGTSWEGDITQYLIDDNGVIPRGRFIDISVRPDTLARVTIAVAPQGFVQSKGGGQY